MNKNPELSAADIKSIPKVELHCHLEACLRYETVMEAGHQLGLQMPTTKEEYEREWLLQAPMRNLADALKRFDNIQKIWTDPAVIERMALEACEDARTQGIRVMEFRYSPDFITAGKPGLKFEAVHSAIVRGIEAGQREDFAVGLIGIVQKTLPMPAAAATMKFITANADTFIGLDFADRETMPLTTYRDLVDEARAAGLNITVHAGEEPTAGAPQEIRDAIEILQAERIGHGLHILGDETVVELAREKKIALEICPTSNWLTGSVSATSEHPVRRLIEAGLPVTINSDDPGLFGIDLCHEYMLLHREHGFSLQDFNDCNETAVRQSFLPEEQKQQAWQRAIDQRQKP